MVGAVSTAVSDVNFSNNFPNLTDPAKVADWAESDPNFLWMCPLHHRGAGGAHHAAYADFEASLYIKGLITK